jgi:hypothetical protein
MSNVFVVGQTVNVFERKGLRALKSGIASSERPGGEYPDLMPDEPLLVLKVYGQTRADVQREDGTIFRIHRNHVVSSATYNIKKQAIKSSGKTTAERLEEARLFLEAAQAAHAAARESEIEEGFVAQA